MELVKRQDRYDLYGTDGSKIASSAPNPFGKLSKENCDEIFGVVDIRKLAYTDFTSEIGEGPTANTDINSIIRKGYLNGAEFGFNKAMELNKDKLLTVEDMIDVLDTYLNDPFDVYDYVENKIQSLQQSTEIEVEIEMVCPQCKDWGYVDECRNNCNKKFLQQKLDENGCIVLRKV